MKKREIALNGILNSNPTFRLVLGTCPTLAVTTTALNSLAMGLAVTFVLICSNFIISLLRKVIPDNIRIAAFITVIATFVTVLQMLMKSFLPDLYSALGIFLPLIVVNCIILGRAEAFASKNPVFDSVLDGLSMGIGFTLSLTLIGIVRELLGNGSVFSLSLGISSPMSIFLLPAGGFFVYGILMAVINHITYKHSGSKAIKSEKTEE